MARMSTLGQKTAVNALLTEGVGQIGVTKAEIADALSRLDGFIDGALNGIDAALGAQLRNSLTARQKALLLLKVIEYRLREGK